MPIPAWIFLILALLPAPHRVPVKPVHGKPPVSTPACTPSIYQQGNGGGC